LIVFSQGKKLSIQLYLYYQKFL